MSAFSRGCLRPHAFPVFRIHTIQPLRCFTTTSLLCAKKPRPIAREKTVPPLLPKTPASILPPTTSPNAYAGYANILAQKSHPTPLYRAPSHVLFMTSSYLGAFTCYGWAAWNGNTMVFNPPPGLAEWIPYAFGLVALMMSAAGTWLIYGTARCIRTITAIPRKANQISHASIRRPGIQNQAMVPAVEGAAPELEIEVVLNKMFPLPFFPARVIYAKPSEIILPSQLSPPNMSPADLRQMRLEEQAMLEQEREYNRNHILTLPFRQLSRGLYEAFRAMRKAWTRDGLTTVTIKGQSYKLDVSGGWALDDGKALDRLAKIKPQRYV